MSSHLCNETESIKTSIKRIKHIIKNIESYDIMCVFVAINKFCEFDIPSTRAEHDRIKERHDRDQNYHKNKRIGD